MESETAYWINSHLDWQVYPKPVEEFTGEELGLLEALDPYETTTVVNECESCMLFGMHSKSYTLMSAKHDGRNTYLVCGSDGDLRVGLFTL